MSVTGDADDKPRGAEEPREAEQPDLADQPRPWRRRHRKLLVGGVIVLVCVVGFFGITGATGLSGPGWLHRYPYADLHDLADRVNEEAGDLRTPDDCWRTTRRRDDVKRDPDGPLREIARPDYLRSRVVVRVYASESGRIDRLTRHAVMNRLDRLFVRHPEFSWAMVVLEPSPDGWSPLVSCRLVTRGWIRGF